MILIKYTLIYLLYLNSGIVLVFIRVLYIVVILFLLKVVIRVKVKVKTGFSGDFLKMGKIFKLFV